MFDVIASAEKTMGMTPDAWARHGNPKSVFSRIVGGTAVFFALWTPFWIGWWSVAPIMLAGFWVWLNPRLFRPPEHAEAWATRGVLGERAFLNRKEVAVPREFERVAWIATAIAIVFLVSAAHAFWQRDFWYAFVAWHAATLAKLWYCDRMVWLWDIMKERSDAYRRWSNAQW